VLTDLYGRKRTQKLLALFIGIAFGFLLQRGGVSRYAVIIGQLRLVDYTVVKMMLSAVIVGMAGVYILKATGLVSLHPKGGSFRALLPGSVLFGAGFALLGYCPGTLVAAAGQGSLDAALAGIPGMLLGAWLFAVLYPVLKGKVSSSGVTLPQLLKLPAGFLVPLVLLLLLAVLFFLEKSGY